MKTEYSSAVYSSADCNFKNISSVYKISISLELNLKVADLYNIQIGDLLKRTNFEGSLNGFGKSVRCKVRNFFRRKNMSAMLLEIESISEVAIDQILSSEIKDEQNLSIVMGDLGLTLKQLLDLKEGDLLNHRIYIGAPLKIVFNGLEIGSADLVEKDGEMRVRIKQLKF